MLFFFKQKTAYDISTCLEFRRVLFRSNQERSKTQYEDRMTQARAKILPERRARTGIVGRKKQREHENQPAEARGPHQNSEKERDANGQLTVGHQERDRCGVPEHEPAKHRRHERVSAALKKTVDPIL